MDSERVDVLVLETGQGGPRNGMRAQVDTLMERARATVVLVRPARPGLSP